MMWVFNSIDEGNQRNHLRWKSTRNQVIISIEWYWKIWVNWYWM